MARPASPPAVAAGLALRGVLLLGGLFALGLLLGGQARAADGAPPVTPPALTAPVLTASPPPASASTAKAVVASLSKAVTEPTPPRSVSGPGPAAGPGSVPPAPPMPSAPAPAPAPAEEASAAPAAPADPVLPALERVVKPVGEVLEGVSERLAAAVTEAAPTVSFPDVPGLPTPPPPGVFPGPSDASSLPSPPVPVPPASAPGLPDLLAPDLPSADLPSADLPVSDLPVSGRPASGPGPDPGTVAPAVPRPSYGPRAVVREAPGGTAAHGGARGRTGRTGPPAPAGRAPTGEPDGVLGSASQLDGGVSRYGDTHAVTPRQRVPLPLVPGGAAHADVAGAAERHRDVLVLPG